MVDILVKAYDLIFIYAVGILCAAFYIAGGIMTLVKKNTQLISKKNKYNEPDLFCTIYGLIEIIGASIALVFLVLGVLFQEQYVLFFVLCAIDVVTMIIILFMVNTKFKVLRK